jgi:hypothetical protein
MGDVKKRIANEFQLTFLLSSGSPDKVGREETPVAAVCRRKHIFQGPFFFGEISIYPPPIRPWWELDTGHAMSLEPVVSD